MEVKRIFDLVEFTHKKYNNSIAFAGKKAGKWIQYSSLQYQIYSNSISCYLLQEGIKPNDCVITISNNRPDWNFADIGIMQTGAIHVPLSISIAEQTLISIIEETQAKWIFLSNKFVYNKIKKIIPDFINSKLISFDQIEGIENIENLKTRIPSVAEISNLQQIKNNILEDQTATIIYTSEITDIIKGVELSHKNIVSNFIAASPTLCLMSNYKGMSYLPLNHAYERMTNYMFQYLGISVYYADTYSSILNNFKEIKPNVIALVPLFLEKIMQEFKKESNYKSAWAKYWLNKAINVNKKKLSLNNYFIDKIIYSFWRKSLGGNIKRIICGGAALKPELFNLYWAANIHVYEGYGLSETSPLLTVNKYKAVKPHTVGQALNGVKLKISENNEILCTGPNLMIGYYKKPELTKQVIDEQGYLHTGDTGYIDDEGYLTLTGRIKTSFKTSSGIYIVPEKNEKILKQSILIKNALIIGAGKSYLTALIVPNIEELKKRFSFEIKEQCSFNNASVLSFYKKEISNYNSQVPETEKIIKFKLVEEKWSIETGELNSLSELNRIAILKHYNTQINELY